MDATQRAAGSERSPGRREVTTDERVTAALSRHADEGALTVQEIAEYAGLTRGVVSSALSRLEAAGLVQKMGIAQNNARCWAITEKEAAR